MILPNTRQFPQRVLSPKALVLAVTCFLTTALPGSAQEAAPAAQQATQQAAPQATPQPPPLRPLEPTEIADSAIAARAVLRDASRAVEATTDLAGIDEGLDTLGKRIDQLERDSQRRMQDDGPGFALEQTEHSWERLDNRLGGWLHTLSANATAVTSALDQIDAERRLWEMTRDSTRTRDVPAAVTREIRQTLAAVDSVQGLVRVARDTILKLQAAVSVQKTRADQNLADQRREISRRRGRLVRIDSPPLWRVFDRSGVDSSLPERAAATWRLNSRSVRWFLEEQGGKLLGSLAFLLLLIAALARLRGVAGTRLQQDDSLRVVAGFLDRPIAAGFFLFGLVGYLAEPNAPRAWRALLGLVLLIAVLRLLPRILTKSTRSWGYVAAAVFFLQQAVNLYEFGTPEGRLLLLLLSLAGLGACLRVTRSEPLAQAEVSKRWSQAIGLGARIASIAFAVGIVANVVGAVGFATVLTTGTVHLIFGALVFWLAARVVLAAVRIGTLTKTASRLGIDSSNAPTVERVARRLVGTLAVLGWASTMLSGYDLLDPAIAALTQVLAAGISVGTFSLTVGDVLVFSLVVWLSFKLSQLICFVLGTDVLPLMNLSRGLPAAIVQLTRYVVVVVGILVAFSAAGVDVDRLTVLFGALGVGVGFGLQNVVNNFASGLIVLFGQGINYDDEVQLEEHEGVVRDIGLLQSTVRTYHGADVLVPNATLISSTVVNWTREDASQRRVDIPLGVAYGTDSKTVIELLEGVANKHPLVARNPAPKALFLGFGESSLNFQLNVWFAENEWYGGASEVRIAASDALNGAGIEVAFPQRDLHLRSVGEGVSIEVSSPPGNETS
jgi:small-conductance mechanosensitive channel